MTEDFSAQVLSGALMIYAIATHIFCSLKAYNLGMLRGRYQKEHLETAHKLKKHKKKTFRSTKVNFVCPTTVYVMQVTRGIL